MKLELIKPVYLYCEIFNPKLHFGGRGSLLIELKKMIDLTDR